MSTNEQSWTIERIGMVLLGGFTPSMVAFFHLGNWRGKHALQGLSSLLSQC